ncbi:inosine monophosphate dehydrogenase-related protein [Nonlabens ulvanivorans]|uniref:Inosine monophosphate dehydrogenase-related protein n=1 Tax=Nonlabens ulvanivorans TaxID=906888 RepID=A0A081D866_NONUL|nr:CBS domain-containing protein [Nonlabens ulvanivorans]GAK75112.1 inosine monophosphate dehydrogenase-relatedprotein [Nonlabens ulvanivorans]GAL74277.1 inosine monophosphate dehydrogenase-related protein [Nonlabens ulvanivorans]
MGIKSFVGKRTGQVSSSNQAFQVKDFMTRKLVTFNPDQGITTVMETLLKQRITGGPVVNEKKELVGIISDTDLMHVIGDSRYHNMPVGDRKVSDYMSKQVDTIEAEADIFEAATRFLKTGHRRFPVTENGTLIGQISRMDVIIAATKLKGEDWQK